MMNWLRLSFTNTRFVAYFYLFCFSFSFTFIDQRYCHLVIESIRRVQRATSKMSAIVAPVDVW